MRGLCTYLIRWEQLYPGDSEVLDALCCPNCDASLLNKAGGRFSHTKVSGLRPVLSFNERPSLVSCWIYPACSCGLISRSTDRAIVINLPRRVTSAWNVDPAWIDPKANQFLSKSLTRAAKSELVTHLGSCALYFFILYFITIMTSFSTYLPSISFSKK